VAALAYVLSSATKHDVDHEVRGVLGAVATCFLSLCRCRMQALNAELQQLGLPRENCDGISRPYRIHRWGGGTGDEKHCEQGA